MDKLLSPDYGLIFWTLVIFGVLLFVLRKFAWKPILTALDERENSIDEALKQAEKARQEMAKLSADNEKLLSQAREERAVILKEAKETSDRMINEAKDKAKAEASKIVEDSRREIEIQKNAALAEVRNEVGTMAIGVAEKILKKQLDNKASQEEYVSGLVGDFKLN